MTPGSRVSPIVERVISQRRRCGEELLEQAEAENVTHGLRNEINSSRRRPLANPCENTALVAFLGFRLQ